MGQLIVQDFVTADGYAADTNNEFKAYELLDGGGTAEFDRAQLEWLGSVEAMVLGANTYRYFAEYWPTDAPKARSSLQPQWLRRHVFSRHLKDAPWGGDFPPSTVESGDAIEGIRRIKRESAKDIVLWGGSLSLGQTFFAAGGEVDAVRLVVMPLGQGSGRGGVFPAGHDPALLKLVDVNSYDQGLVELSYLVLKR